MEDENLKEKVFAIVFRMLPERWNCHADITGPIPLEPDDKVDMRDIGLIARHFGETYP